jgi:PAS domain S-box-containing protein
MLDFFQNLFDTTGFPAQGVGEGWSEGLIWLHNISDLLFWLACLTMAVVLVFLASQRRAMPFHRIFWLFGIFLLCCGMTHFLEVVTFQIPLQRAVGFMKLLAALAAWISVVALVPTVPRVLNLLWQAPDVSKNTVRLVRAVDQSLSWRYGTAIAVAGLATLARLVLDPLLGNNHPFLISLLCVVLVAWRGGMGPALLCLFLCAATATYLFVPPRNSFIISGLEHQIGLGVFCFVGVGCALLGEFQRDAWLRAEAGLAALTRQQRLLEEEIERRKRFETQLRQSEARFRTLAEAMPQLVWTSKADGTLDYFNQRWYDYTGLTQEESTGSGWQQAVHPEDRERLIARWQAAVRENRLYEIEYRLRRKDGSYRWFLTRAQPESGDGKTVAQWFGTCTDIDDQKRTEQQLRQTEQRFRLLADEIPQMVWRANPAGEVIDYNRRWYDYTGLTFEQTQGQGWQQVLHPEDKEEGIRRWQTALQQGDRIEIEQRLRRGQDGSYRWHLVRGLPLRDERGGIEQWVGTITDIDEQRRQAEALEQQVQSRTAALVAANNSLRQEVEERWRAEDLARTFALELQRSNRELEQFAAVASHDLQEPLRKIQAFGDRLQSRCAAQLGEQGLDFLGRILASAGRMRRLIDDLLAYSRVTTRGQAFVPVDLGAMAREVVSDLEGRLQQVGGFVEVGELPTVEADPL